MAKGEQRSNREAKKPKKEKIKVIAAAPSQKGQPGSRPWVPAKRNNDGHPLIGRGLHFQTSVAYFGASGRFLTNSPEGRYLDCKQAPKERSRSKAHCSLQ